MLRVAKGFKIALFGTKRGIEHQLIITIYSQYCKTCLKDVHGVRYVACRNSVALAEENKGSPDAGISIVTSEEFQMGYPELQVLSIQDLPKDFASKQPCGGNQTMPRDLIELPFLFQDTNLVQRTQVPKLLTYM